MAPSGYAITFEEIAGILVARVRGKRTRENVIHITREVFAQAVESRNTKVMTDVKELSGRLGVIDDYFIVTELFGELRGKGVAKAAIVDVEESPIHEWFIEVVARNRGYNFKVFSDETDAMDWLES